MQDHNIYAKHNLYHVLNYIICPQGSNPQGIWYPGDPIPWGSSGSNLSLGDPIPKGIKPQLTNGPQTSQLPSLYR